MPRPPCDRPCVTISDDVIRDIVHTPFSVQLTQCIHKLLGELVSGAAEKVIGVEAKDGYVNATMRHSSDFLNPLLEGSF